MANFDPVALVKQYKALEEIALSKFEPEEKAKWLEQRAISAEEMLSQMSLEQDKAEVLKKFPSVEADDLSDVKSVAEAEKLASRIQAKADKVTATEKAKWEEVLGQSLTKEEADNLKKAYGRPRQVADTTTEQASDDEQKRELGSKLTNNESKIEFGTRKGLEDAAKAAATKGMEALFGRNG